MLPALPDVGGLALLVLCDEQGHSPTDEIGHRLPGVSGDVLELPVLNFFDAYLKVFHDFAPWCRGEHNAHQRRQELRDKRILEEIDVWLENSSGTRPYGRSAELRQRVRTLLARVTHPAMWIFVIPVILFASLTFAGGMSTPADKQPGQVQAPTSQALPTDSPKR